MAEVNHINYLTEDGKLYCRLLNDVIKLANYPAICDGCPYIAGSAQGQGRECSWDDPRDDIEFGFIPVEDPYQECYEIMLAQLLKDKKEMK